MDRVDWGRNSRHLGKRRSKRSRHHRTTDRFNAHLLRCGRDEVVFDWRDRWELHSAAIASAGEEAIDLVEDIAALGTRAR